MTNPVPFMNPAMMAGLPDDPEALKALIAQMMGQGVGHVGLVDVASRVAHREMAQGARDRLAVGVLAAAAFDQQKR